MKKLFDSLKIFGLLAVAAILASCNGFTEKPDSEKKAYFKFSVNTIDRSAYYPTAFTEDSVDKLLFKIEDMDDNSLPPYFEKEFERTAEKNAIKVFEETVLEWNPIKEGQEYHPWGQYNFIIELYSEDFCETVEKDGTQVKYYTPIQDAKLERVLVVPGLNDLHFETKHYLRDNWEYRSLLNFEYKIKDNLGVGYMTVDLRTWPYNNKIWNPRWSSEKRQLADQWPECYYPNSEKGVALVKQDGYLKLAASEYIADGDYKLIVNLYDKEGGTVLKTFSDNVCLSGYKTEVFKEISFDNFEKGGVVEMPYELLQNVSVDEAYSLCKNHGTVEIINNSGNTGVTYAAELYYKGDLLGALTVNGNKASWNENLFEGKQAVNGIYSCQIFVKSTYQGVSGGQSFKVDVPDRTYISYSVAAPSNGTEGQTAAPVNSDYLDPDNPPQAVRDLTGNYLIHLYGAGTQTYDTENGRVWGTVHKYVWMLRSMNKNANIFFDMTDITGITKLYWNEVELEKVVTPGENAASVNEPGAVLVGIALPDSVVELDNNIFLCPSTDERQYELTVVLGSKINTVEYLSDSCEWTFQNTHNYANSNNSDAIPYRNPFRKFIVHNNPRLLVYEDGAIVAKRNDDGWTYIIGAADVDAIKELKIPLGINKISISTFAGCSKLKKIVDWGDVSEIGHGAFNYSGLTGEVVLGKYIFLVPSAAFYNTGVTNLVLSDSVKYLGENVVPATATIGYKVDSQTRHYWNYVAVPQNNEDLPDWKMVSAMWGNDPFPTAQGQIIIFDWPVKYTNQDMNKLYCWRAD